MMSKPYSDVLTKSVFVVILMSTSMASAESLFGPFFGSFFESLFGGMKASANSNFETSPGAERNTYRCDLPDESDDSSVSGMTQSSEEKIPLPSQLRFRVDIVDKGVTPDEVEYAKVEAWSGTIDDPNSIKTDLSCRRLVTEPSLSGDLISIRCTSKDKQFDMTLLLSADRKSLAYSAESTVKTEGNVPALGVKDPRALKCRRELKWSDIE